MKTGQHTDEQEVAAEGKSQPEVLLGVGRWKINTTAVRNYGEFKICSAGWLLVVRYWSVFDAAAPGVD